MDSWWTLALCFFISLLYLLASQLNKGKRGRKLPPGPPSVPLLGSVLFLTKGVAGLPEACRELRARYGSIFTLYAGSSPIVLIADTELAHKLLVQEHSMAFADRPLANKIENIFTAKQYSINSAPYGPLWRTLRRNLVSEVLHPSRVKMYSDGRVWAVRLLLDKFEEQATASANRMVTPFNSMEFTFFGLLSFVCFGVRLEEKIIRSIQQNVMSLHSFVLGDLYVFKFLTKFTNFMWPSKWNQMLELHERVRADFIPLIQARRDQKSSSGDSQNFAYVDSLLDLHLPNEGGRKLTQDEVVSLCLEIYVAGVGTFAVALQWAMARLVKHPNIQEKLVEDIKRVVGAESEWISEEDAKKSPYLRGVIKESLRLHPPGHFLLSHSTSTDVQVDEYVIPKGTTVNVAIGAINRDGKLWQDTMEFNPERFMPGGEGEREDILGSKGKMMIPFGVGRRSCPAAGVASQYLEYFVANLLWKFEWKAVEGEEVDMTEATMFTTFMKNPLRARLLPRRM